jgi:hypothetical protein
MGKNIFIQDVEKLAVSCSLAATAMSSILNFVQDYVVSKSIF